MENTEREDLEHMMATPGWARWVAFVEREWGTREKGGGAYFTMAARKAIDNPDDSSALSHLRQIGVAQKEVHNLFAWLEAKLKKPDAELVALAANKDYSRRGGL